MPLGSSIGEVRRGWASRRVFVREFNRRERRELLYGTSIPPIASESQARAAFGYARFIKRWGFPRLALTFVLAVGAWWVVARSTVDVSGVIAIGAVGIVVGIREQLRVRSIERQAVAHLESS